MKNIIITSIALLITITCTKAQEKIHFKIKPEIGKNIKYELTTTSEMEGEGKIMDMSMGLSYKPTSIQMDTISLDILFTHFKINMDMMGLNYDSTKESTDESSKEIEKEIKPLFETPTSVKINTSGKVVEKPETSADNVLVGNISLDNFSIAFPDKPVSLGESWDSEIFYQQAGRTVPIKYTYVETNMEGHRLKSEVLLDNQLMSGYVIINPKTHLVDKSYMELNNPQVKLKVIVNANVVQ